MDVLSKLFVEGEEKIGKEFSMDKLLTSLREIKLLLKLKGDLTKEQKKNLKFMPQAVIDLDDFDDKDDNLDKS